MFCRKMQLVQLHVVVTISLLFLISVQCWLGVDSFVFRHAIKTKHPRRSCSSPSITSTSFITSATTSTHLCLAGQRRSTNNKNSNKPKKKKKKDVQQHGHEEQKDKN
mmetsp:Transcript_24604/g.52033  ORF Transcript_24604/g.52033 Transcript_24604/m.52033 type:complete len:107 (+) Transcript_24604:283-603(+)